MTDRDTSPSSLQDKSTIRSMKRTISDNTNNCDPGGFGRALRARHHQERFQQDTGFFGLHLGWEQGTSPDVSPLQQRHGHQWRLRTNDMAALDYSQPFASSTQWNNGTPLVSPEATRAAAKSTTSGGSGSASQPVLTVNAKQPISEMEDTQHKMIRKKYEIEIAPGIYSPLRSADETFKAIENDFYVRCTCGSCFQPIFCIQNAKHVHCPKLQTNIAHGQLRWTC